MMKRLRQSEFGGAENMAMVLSYETFMGLGYVRPTPRHVALIARPTWKRHAARAAFHRQAARGAKVSLAPRAWRK